MATKKKKGTRMILEVCTTETAAGLKWLNELDEDRFRDTVLIELFRRMESEKLISGFEKIHGRTDKGIDYLIGYSGVFESTTVIGIQVKSKTITRSEGAGSLSAIRIRGECEAAVLHDFHYKGGQIKLDWVELWCSGHITEDAEKELNPPHGKIRIRLKKDREILSLLEKYCPQLLGKIPQLALTRYLQESRNPPSKTMRILGHSLNPKTNFIEPFFSSLPSNSFNQLQKKGGILEAKRNEFTIEDILSEQGHSIILSGPLSGRSYLLEHLKCRFAEQNRIPLLIKAVDLPKDGIRLENVISEQLRFINKSQINDLQKRVGLVLLIDDLDKAHPSVRDIVFQQASLGIRIVATAKSLLAPSGVKCFHLIGVSWISVVRFLRSIDNPLSAGKPFVDRARSFIERSFMSCGLPRNPFTIAVMLEECNHTASRFSTPTMGRLIGRFIEMQLGSHSEDAFVVDFETKLEFLTRLAGHAKVSFPIAEFEKLLGKFIETKGHPHSITDFIVDLLRSGVFQRIDARISWSHPVIKEFFWVKNLLANGKSGPILKRLEQYADPTLGALVGSQLGDAAELIRVLRPKLDALKAPKLEDILASPEFACSLANLISDKDEETILADLEQGKGFGNGKPNGEGATTKQTRQATTLTPDARRELKKRFEPIVQRIVDNQFHLAMNVASLVVNGRNTSR
ncbi:MAG: hypothetical protein AB1813_03935, partial [Verrucomicrobiota bacterium]